MTGLLFLIGGKMENILLITFTVITLASTVCLTYAIHKIKELKSRKDELFRVYQKTSNDLYDYRLREKELDAVKLEDLTNDAIFVPLTSERYSDLVKKELELIDLKLKLKGLDNEKQND